MTRMHRLRRVLAIVVVNLVVTVLMSEIVLRIYAATAGHTLLVHDGIDAYRLEPSRDYGRLWTNRYGYASREFELERRPGLVRVALLGDSFAVGSVRQDENFASWMERLHPGLEVYNFGVSAIGPAEYATILEEEALRFRPDVVLVAFFVGNDATAAPRAQPRWTTPVLPLFVKRAWRLGREWFRLRFASPPPLALPQLAHPSLPQPGFNLSRETYLEVERERLVVSRRSMEAATAPSWEEAFEHLRAMRDAARRHGARFAILVIPDEFQVSSALLDNVVESAGIAIDDVDLTLPQRKLRDFCLAEAIDCLDLLPLFSSEADTYLPQDTHWNEKGNRLAGEALVAWLDESGLLAARH